MSQIFDIQWPIDNLSKTCVYSIDLDYYSQFYEVDAICKCGHKDWMNALVVVNVSDNQIPLSPKRIQRCAACNQVRTCNLKNEFIDIISTSNNCLTTLQDAFIKKGKTQNELLYTLKNMVANLEISVGKKRLEEHKEEKILSLEKFCQNIKIDPTLMLETVRKMSQENVSKQM